MVPTLTRFGFETYVPVSGFHWLSAVEAKRLKLSHENGFTFGTLPLLLRTYNIAEHEDEGDGYVLRRPLEDEPALYRKFVSLQTDNLGDLKEFADAHGCLGDPGLGQSVEFVANSLVAGRFCPLARKCEGGWLVKVDGESHASWVCAITLLRIAVNVFDWLQAEDGVALRKVLRFEPRPPLPPELIKGNEELLSTYGNGLGGYWWIDTSRDQGLPKLTHDPNRVRRFVLVPGRQLSANENILDVGWAWLLAAVNEHLRDRSSPFLARTQDGQITQEFVPRDLHAAMWGQLYQAITGDKLARSCDACGKWYEIFNGPNGHTVRKLYCTPTCRTNKSRERKEQAIRLGGEGITPQEIVNRLSASGGKTTLASVKKWLKKPKSKG